jgi:hypothetical protein
MHRLNIRIALEIRLVQRKDVGQAISLHDCVGGDISRGPDKSFRG